MTHPEGDAAEHRQARALEALTEVAFRSMAAERLAPRATATALGAIADVASAAFDVMAISIALHDPALDRLVFRAAAGPEGPGVIGLSIGAHDGIAGYVYTTGQALAVADATADPRFERATAERTGYVPRSMLAVPLVDDAGIIGVMEVLDRRDGAPFDLADVELATRLSVAATAVARSTGLERDSAALLRSVMATMAGDDQGAPDATDLEALISEVVTRLDDDRGTWPLADRIGRLRAADPDDLTLAVAWLDALIDRQRRRSPAARWSEDRDSRG